MAGAGDADKTDARKQRAKRRVVFGANIGRKRAGHGKRRAFKLRAGWGRETLNLRHGGGDRCQANAPAWRRSLKTQILQQETADGRFRNSAA